MKKFNFIAIIALMSLGLFSCDIASPRPNTGTVKIVLEDIPADGSVKAVSIWCTANEWKKDNVNGSTQYIAPVVISSGKASATFTLKDYVLSVPLQFQFTPMPTVDTKLGDDWWSYAISGSDAYANDKNNITCDFAAKGGYDGCTITVNKTTYSEWKASFPIYGVNSIRWFNNSWKDCFECK